MKTERRKITPEIASQLLEMNFSNRRLKESVINAYSNEMKKGEWKMTGEGIKVSKTNRLLDGQHRLHAVVKSGVSVDMLIISDLDEDIFNVLDTGSVRSAGDVLSIDRVANPALVASIARFIINYNNGLFDPSNSGKATRPNNRDIQKFVDANPEVIDIAKDVCKHYKFKLLNSSILGGMYFVFSKIHDESAEIFTEKLVNGLDLKKDCPIMVLREKLIRDQANKTRLTITEKVVLLIHAWNAYRLNKSVKSLRIDTNVKPKAI